MMSGEFLTYTSKHGAASIRVTKGGKVVLDGDYGARKTVLIDDDMIHLPEGSDRKSDPLKDKLLHGQKTRE